MKNWQEDHKRVMTSFLKILNQESDKFILKGGTALSMCYRLDRFSEDIDLDGTQKGIKEIVDKFCDKNGYTFRTAKDTNTVQRYFINYGNKSKPLKIEISYRRKEIPENEIIKINGINTYTINVLCIMKNNAYLNRDQIRDLFDLSFIINNYLNQLDPSTILMVQSALQTKGVEQFDYLVNTQSDDLIDNDMLETNFLKMYEKLGLLTDDEDSISLESEDINEHYTEIKRK